MNFLKYILGCFSILVILVSCNKGIDPIEPVAPGQDMSAPEITVTYPDSGALISSQYDTISINIVYTVTDDIEISSISVKLDNIEIDNLSSFKDYRIVMQTYNYDMLTNGDHILTITATDNSGKITTKTVPFTKGPYKAIYDGEIFYMPFDGTYTELISNTDATVIGTPGYGIGIKGTAYKGETDSYLSYPVNGLQNNEFSAVFWMKINDNPNRAGILVMSPIDSNHIADPANMNNRTKGFRFLREVGASPAQRFKLNIGTGGVDQWFDGGTNADVTPNTGEWVFFAFTISPTYCAVYINGEVVKDGNLSNPIDWTGCNTFSIMSGKPYFNQWGHGSDRSLIDELRIFNKALTKDEVNTIMNDEK